MPTPSSPARGDSYDLAPPLVLLLSFVLAILAALALDAGTAWADTPVDAQRDLRMKDEVIEIRELRPPPVLPKPQFDIQRAPPYSEAAITSDTWTKAWLLLEIDERGSVKRFKFLKRPGLGLEGIAAKQVFAMSFAPARDAGDQAIPTLVVWGMEWPSYWWLLERTRSVNRIPPYYSGIPGQPSLRSVPCQLGTKHPSAGPLVWDSIYRTHRDCSRPDLRKASIEPWIVRS